MSRITICDPPSGWRYGFPRVLPDDVEYADLLKLHGYPEKDMKLALEHSRFWIEEVDE